MPSNFVDTYKKVTFAGQISSKENNNKKYI
jgi:hypothetical protein